MSSHASAHQTSSVLARLDRLAGLLAFDPSNLKLRGEMFDTALSGGLFGRASEQTTWALSRQPANLEWRHRLVLLDLAEGQWQEAQLLCQGLINEGFDVPAIHFNLAWAEYGQKSYEAAQQRLAELIERVGEADGLLEQALALRLRCLHRLGRIDDAMALLLSRDTNDLGPEVNGVASLLAIDGQRLDMAAQWSNQALRQNPLQHEALVAHGTICLAERDAVGAKASLNLALEKQPGDGRTLSAIGFACLLSVDLLAAEKAFRQAVLAMPGHIGTWHGLGWCEVLRKDLDAASVAFETALDLDHNFAESHGGLAVVLALQGHVGEAEAAIRRAQGLDNACLSARYAQSVLSGEVNDSARFQKLAQRVLGAQQDAQGRSLLDLVMKSSKRNSRTSIGG